jgi:prepilin-type N-terminal cleavage/methylation domain-containing protein
MREGLHKNSSLGRPGQAAYGFSLIELMIAIAVLAVGMSALVGLFITAVMNNGRSKGDTTATMLAQTVLEKIAAQPASSAATFTLTDCNPSGGTNWTIATAGAASPGAGANLDSNTASIDFTQSYSAVSANYKMQFVSCGNNGRQATYDVRWNIQTIVANRTRVITVSARPQSAGNASSVSNLMFALPVTLRTVGGLQ